jgi:hypothetical protein
MQTTTSTSPRIRSFAAALACAAVLATGCPEREAEAPPPAPAPEPAAAGGGAADLVARISARDRYAAGEPVAIDFALENRGPAAVSVLVWNTPLEGVTSEMFRVTRGGEPVPYSGPVTKRGDPGAEEYRRIEPGQEATASVALGEGWDVGVAGEYEVTLETRLADVAPADAALPRPRDAHTGVDLRAGPLRFTVE